MPFARPPSARWLAPLSVLVPALAMLVAVSLSTGAWAADVQAASSLSEGPSPRAVVESLHEVILQCMKGACGPGFRDRYERIVAELDETFDLAFMARVSVGKAWSGLSHEEKKAYYDLSRRLSASNYANNFDSYGGQTFETMGEEPAPRGTVLVKTEFVQPKDDNVRFDYRLRQIDGRWRIIDITLDGTVSEITLRRASYGAVIERRGFAELIVGLEAKIAKIEEK